MQAEEAANREDLRIVHRMTNDILGEGPTNKDGPVREPLAVLVA